MPDLVIVQGGQIPAGTEVAYALLGSGARALVGAHVITTDFANDPRNRIEQLLSLNGDGTGETDQTAATGAFYIAPPAGEIYSLSRINIHMHAGMNDKFDASKYGADTALANGLLLSVKDPSSTLKVLTPFPIKHISLWNLYTGIDILFTDFPAGTSDMAAIRWTFLKGGGPIVLDGDNQEWLELTVQDNLGAGGAGLPQHLALAQGTRLIKNG